MSRVSSSVVPTSLRTKAVQIFALRHEPLNYVAGEYMLVAKIKDLLDRRKEVFMVHTWSGWERIEPVAYLKRFHLVPPIEVMLDMIATCDRTEDIELGEQSGRHYDLDAFNLATDELLVIIMRATRTVRRQPRVTRNGGYLGINTRKLRHLIQPAPTPPVHTAGLRQLLVDRGLRKVQQRQQEM